MRQCTEKQGTLPSPLLLPLLCVVLAACVPPSVGAKGIVVSLEAPWCETPYLQEGCEWAGRSRGAEAFFQCLTAVWNITKHKRKLASTDATEASRWSGGARTLQQQTQYIVMQEVVRDSFHGSASEEAMFAMEMALRVYSPAVEAHYGLAVDAASARVDTCTKEPFATVAASDGSEVNQATVVHSAETLQDAVDLAAKLSSVGRGRVGGASPPYWIPGLDYPHPSSEASTPRVVVTVYGLVGDGASSKALFDAALRSTQRPSSGVLLLFRHLPASVRRVCSGAGGGTAADKGPWDQPLRLQGYGATVDFKSMEYKVVDEKAAAASTSGAGTTSGMGDGLVADMYTEDDESSIIAGVQVGQLKKRFPDLRSSLDTFASFLEDTVASAANVRVDLDMWELQSIGLAATRLVSEIPTPEEKRRVLTDIVTNFPLYAQKLVEIAMNESRLATTMEEVHELQANVIAGVSATFLNGVSIPGRDLSLYGLLERVREADRLTKQVAAILLRRHPTLLPPAPTAADTHHGAGSGSSDDISAGEATETRNETEVLRVARSIAMTVSSSHLGDGGAEGSDRRVYISQENIHWINDLETDEVYDELPRSLRVLSTAAMAKPNWLPPRRNVIHMVAVMDPSEPDNLEALAEVINLYHRGLPMRFGVALVDNGWSGEVPAPADEMMQSTVSGASVSPPPSSSSPSSPSPSSSLTILIAAAIRAVEKAGADVGTFLSSLAHQTTLIKQQGLMSNDRRTEALQRVIAEALEGITDTPPEELVSEESFLSEYHLSQKELHQASGKREGFSIMVNGATVEGDPTRTFISEIVSIEKMIVAGVLTDDMTDLYSAIMTHYGARRSAQPALADTSTLLQLHSTATVDFIQSRPWLHPSTYSGAIPLISNVVYLPCNASAVESLRILHSALTALGRCLPPPNTNEFANVALPEEKCLPVQMTLLACPSTVTTAAAESTVAGELERLLRAVADLAEGKRLMKLLDFVSYLLARVEVTKLSVDAQLADPLTLKTLVMGSALPASIAKLLPLEYKSVEAGEGELHERLTRHVYRVVEGQHYARPDGLLLISNGRVVQLDTSFAVEDFMDATRQQLSMARQVAELLEQVDFISLSSAFTSDELGASFYASRIAELASLRSTSLVDVILEADALPTLEPFSSISFVVEPPAGVAARHEITAIIDPSSREAQTLLSICSFLSRSPLGVRLTVVMNPSLRVERPIRNLYTFLARFAPAFDPVTGSVVTPSAVFRGLPPHALLTLGVEEPETWMVLPLRATHDLDNILLDRLPPGVEYLTAVYGLRALLVTGSGNQAKGPPTRGLPLVLRPASSSSGGTATDTLVMETLSYFQLRATPGLWHLSVQPGPAASSFYVHTVDDVAAPLPSASDDNAAHRNFTVGQAIPVIVDSLTGRHLRLGVSSVPGHARTVEEVAAEISSAAAASRTWPAQAQAGENRPRPSRPTLNIFSVASGHLYERFLRMMMHSVATASSDKFSVNTTRVKFWVIENFLSPPFKDYIPLLAEHYGFEVGFVSYRWPWWLHRQTEKQRKIWAYKILFLDVIFPLDVDRVIFVDADQRAQADLHELYTMDIGDHAIAMAPFCTKNPNKSTMQFRFWSKGYWKDRLGSRPYHISAIFLVDLQRFRALRAGDIYRSMYHSLSRDVNSLANLDQDLPNSLQSVVPIYSLPEEWLWCETWCSMATKDRAKTIDLCNNPLTKMPKLDNAKYIFPNWEEIDNMLETVARDVIARARAGQ